MLPALIFLFATSAACGDPVSVQVLLDRRGFSPGEIDGQIGAATRRAITAFQQDNQLNETGQPDCATWAALTRDDDAETLTTYTITPADAAGPFLEKIPREIPDQAGLPALGYSSLAELLAERFHASPRLIARLNPRVPLEAGATIRVPAVTPFDPSARPEPPARTRGQAPPMTIEVVGANASLALKDADGRIRLFAPVTSGSAHDPLPRGEWKVTSIDRHPTFHYNPDLFWDADPSHSKATIKPGPNNPVGVVWIGINVEHYGLHGTPEPSAVGRTTSHGCVRLTNWDAARLASQIAVGTAVVFK